jgi:hypothetical protein
MRTMTIGTGSRILIVQVYRRLPVIVLQIRCQLGRVALATDLNLGIDELKTRQSSLAIVGIVTVPTRGSRVFALVFPRTCQKLSVHPL